MIECLQCLLDTLVLLHVVPNLMVHTSWRWLSEMSSRDFRSNSNIHNHTHAQTCLKHIPLISMCCLIILIHPPENQQLAPLQIGKFFFQFPVGISYISDIFRYAINGWNTWHVLLKDIQDHEANSGRIRITSHRDHLLPALVDSHSVRGYVHRYGHLTRRLKGGDMWNIDKIWRK